jgi:molecular chaperone DnaK
MARDNRTIGRFMLDGIPPAPRGVPQIEVTFDIDANGILNVGAKDKGTGKEQTIKIQASTGLSKDEVEKMKADARANEAADRTAREKADKLNTADSLIFQTEKQLKEFGEKIPADKKTTIESALTRLKDAHKGGDATSIDAAMNDLNQAWQAASEDLYKAQQQQGAPTEGPNMGGDNQNENTAKDDNVQDVPFEEVKDDKK